MSRKITTTYALIAGLLSVALHVAVVGAANRVDFNVLRIDKEEETEKDDRPLQLKTVDVRDRMQRSRTRSNDTSETTDKLAEEVAQKKLKDIFKEENLIEDPDPELELKDPGSSENQPNKPGTESEPREASAPRPEIVSIDSENLSEVARKNSASRWNIEEKERTQVTSDKNIPSLVESGPLQSAQGGKYQASMKMSLPEAGDMQVGEGPGPLKLNGERTEEKQMDFAPMESTAPSVSSSSAGQQERRTRKEIQQMRNLLNVSLVTSKERDGGGTFRIDVAPNPKSNLLRAIPKNILFLIDSSTSVSPKKFKHFKLATRRALQQLHPDDKFNIVSFKVRPNKLFQNYQPVNESNLQQGEKYLDRLSRGGLTDVYGGLAPCIKDSRSTKSRPVIVFLMTDGESTVKDKRENDELIRQIVKLNEANAAIYSFSTGDEVNRFLLDFLAYSNRGTALHAEEIKNFREELVTFMKQHSELIVQNLNFQLTGHVEGTVYPKKLPHLFRNEVLSIYGRFNADTENIAIRLTGRDATNKLSELVYKGSTSQTPEAEANLQLDWASQKVFHLISQRTLNPEKKGINERIRALAKKYNLYVPYL